MNVSNRYHISRASFTQCRRTSRRTALTSYSRPSTIPEVSCPSNIIQYHEHKHTRRRTFHFVFSGCKWPSELHIYERFCNTRWSYLSHNIANHRVKRTLSIPILAMLTTVPFVILLLSTLQSWPIPGLTLAKKLPTNQFNQGLIPALSGSKACHAWMSLSTTAIALLFVLHLYKKKN
jgi:hypothetical protein